jgi:hypothetical protein
LPLLDSSVKKAAENMFRGVLFGAQHITRARVRKRFRRLRMPEMPCFLGSRAHGAAGELSRETHTARQTMYESSPKTSVTRSQRVCDATSQSAFKYL